MKRANSLLPCRTCEVYARDTRARIQLAVVVVPDKKSPLACVSVYVRANRDIYKMFSVKIVYCQFTMEYVDDEEEANDGQHKAGR